MQRCEVFDGVDRQLIEALQLDGRAPLRRIADTLAIPERSLARRYDRLRATRAVRVVGRTHPHAIGETPWLVRVRCGPGAAPAVGGVLAARPETSWVKLVNGGTEVVAVVRIPVDGDSALLERLPRGRGVLEVTVAHVLHVFFGGTDSVVHDLSDDQVRELRRGPSPTVSGGRLDDVDKRILHRLHDDGRADIASVSRSAGVAPTTVRRRLADLLRRGVLYFDVDVDYDALGLRCQAILWLSVGPAAWTEVGAVLADQPQVAFAAATTGPSNVYVSVVCPDAPALFDYLSTQVAALPALRAFESAPVTRTLKRL